MSLTPKAAALVFGLIAASLLDAPASAGQPARPPAPLPPATSRVAAATANLEAIDARLVQVKAEATALAGEQRTLLGRLRQLKLTRQMRVLERERTTARLADESGRVSRFEGLQAQLSREEEALIEAMAQQQVLLRHVREPRDVTRDLLAELAAARDRLDMSVHRLTAEATPSPTTITATRRIRSTAIWRRSTSTRDSRFRRGSRSEPWERPPPEARPCTSSFGSTAARSIPYNG